MQWNSAMQNGLAIKKQNGLAIKKKE